MENHIRNIFAKANKTIGFLKRNVHISNSNIKQKAYIYLVRPTVEYASALWDPHLQKDKHKLEMVKRRLARFVTNQYSNRSFVTDKLEQLKWTPLEDRRKDARLLMLYKIRNQEVNISASHKLIPPDRISRNTSTNSFQISQCNTTTRKESFYPKTIRD